MPPRKTAVRAASTDPAVDALLADLDHPLKAEIESLRRLILAAAPEIREELKWNSPSFRTTEHFATINFRAKDCLRVVLHLGAKARSTAKTGISISDPDKLLEWPGKDRAIAAFRGAEEVRGRGAALQAIIREWIGYV